MTSLIDVIFLLLLFFMLTSTFTRFAEVELTAAGGGAAPSDVRPLFLQLGEDTLGLNGQTLALSDLPQTLLDQKTDSSKLPVIIALRSGVSSQRLTDLLVTLRNVPGISATVLGAS
ncbi:ExbD/TolR family protein [Pelagimonas varians]|uniref:Biopolymer transport protein ExbD/TolR n=1 Tax=Pelagimonas varians TaxID=696760 RepID=A0A238KEG8_9RHOB|nr:outer membrane transport energization protein ExbD [Pelagimonas varians]SMX41265.1 Biopolymer transport protein ExbD/TolR [Pelagimonas varians]